MRRSLAALPLVAAALTGCASSSKPAADPPPPEVQATQAALPPAPPATGPVGSSYHDGPLTVTVDSVKLEPQLNAPGGIPDPEQPTNGQWAAIHATIVNTGGIPVEPGQLFVKTADGTTWDSNTEGDLYGQELPHSTVAGGDRSAGLVFVDLPKPASGDVVYEDASQQIVYRWPLPAGGR